MKLSIKIVSVVLLLALAASAAHGGRFSTSASRLNALGNLGSSDARSYSPISKITDDVYVRESREFYRSDRIGKDGKYKRMWYNVCDVYQEVEKTYDGGVLIGTRVIRTYKVNCRLVITTELDI